MCSFNVPEWADQIFLTREIDDPFSVPDWVLEILFALKMDDSERLVPRQSSRPLIPPAPLPLAPLSQLLYAKSFNAPKWMFELFDLAFPENNDPWKMSIQRWSDCTDEECFCAFVRLAQIHMRKWFIKIRASNFFFPWNIIADQMYSVKDIFSLACVSKQICPPLCFSYNFHLREKFKIIEKLMEENHYLEETFKEVHRFDRMRRFVKQKIYLSTCNPLSSSPVKEEKMFDEIEHNSSIFDILNLIKKYCI